MIFRSARIWLVVVGALCMGSRAGAQSDPGDKPETQAPASQTSPSTNPDAMVVGGSEIKPKTPAELETAAWAMLGDALGDDKHAERRVQAVAALALLGGNPRSLAMLRTAMKDRDVDVRTAAAIGAGRTGSPSVTSDLRRMLDDHEPQVAYSAALALWKMNDRSGEDVLVAVVDGDRKASAGLVSGTEHTVNKDLHSPSALAKMGALQGASMLLGPFGIGISAYEYMRKNGGDSARAAAIDSLAEERTKPVEQVLIAALDDKDPGVRAAALKALAGFHEAAATAAIAAHFDDAKEPVRLTAGAAYLISKNLSEASPKVRAKSALRKGR